MILLLDAGNTRIKWGRWQDGQWLDRGAVPVADVAALASVVGGTKPAWVGVSCVAGESVRAGLVATLAAAGVTPYWLASAAAGHGLVNRYRQPDALGVDRYAALIASVRGGCAPCVVVSAGTAVTVDALAGNGEFLGGMILPGMALMRSALGSATGVVVRSDGVWNSFPKGTGDAVTTGLRTAIAATVRTMHARLVGELGRNAGIVASGGDAEVLAASLRADGWCGAVEINEYLVLEGLLWVARDLGVADA